jgi:hypothetical protein
MRKILVAAAVLLSLGPASAGPKEEALQVLGRWTPAFAESVVDGVVMLYATDALFFGPGSKSPGTKPQDIRLYFERALLTNRPRDAVLGEHAVRAGCRCHRALPSIGSP